MSATGHRRSLIATLVATLVAAILLPSAPASAATGEHLINVHSHLCLSSAGGSAGVNVAIVQYTCDQDPSRFWTYSPFPGGGTYIRNVRSGLCLSPAGGSTGLNVVLVQYYCDTNPARSWDFRFFDPTAYYGPDSVYMHNRFTGLCASPAGGSAGLNVVAVQYNCDNDFARAWHGDPTS